jgi:hypothetical protein
MKLEAGQKFKDEHGEILTIVSVVETDIDKYGTVYASSSKGSSSIYAKLEDEDFEFNGTIPFFLETFLEKVTHVQDH